MFCRVQLYYISSNIYYILLIIAGVESHLCSIFNDGHTVGHERTKIRKKGSCDSLFFLHRRTTFYKKKITAAQIKTPLQTVDMMIDRPISIDIIEISEDEYKKNCLKQIE